MKNGHNILEKEKIKKWLKNKKIYSKIHNIKIATKVAISFAKHIYDSMLQKETQYYNDVTKILQKYNEFYWLFDKNVI